MNKRIIYNNRRARLLDYNEEADIYTIYYIDDGVIVEARMDDYESEIRTQPSDEEWEEAV